MRECPGCPYEASACEVCSYRTLEPFLALKAYFEASEALRAAEIASATAETLHGFDVAQDDVKKFRQAREDARQEYLKLTK